MALSRFRYAPALLLPRACHHRRLAARTETFIHVDGSMYALTGAGAILLPVTLYTCIDTLRLDRMYAYASGMLPSLAR